MTSPARGAEAPARVRDVLRVPEFRALLASSVLSITGDQVARIAVALLVYERTGSSFAAAATYACSYLTWLVGGLVLSTVADRVPRRRLMVWCDLLRAAAVALLLVPQAPVALVFVVLLLVGVLSPPFDAAKSAVLPEVLPGDAYTVGNGLQSSVFQAANALGFVLGGAAVALVGIRGALALDALSFLLSAALLATGVRERPMPPRDGASLLTDTAAGVGLVTRDQDLRRLLAFGLLGAVVLIAPEGLAVPVAADLHLGAPNASATAAYSAGLLTAAAPAGFLVGSALLLRLPQARRVARMPAMVVGAGAALLLTPALAQVSGTLGTVLVALAWGGAGAGSAMLLVANAAYMRAVPVAMRARAFGVANTALMVLQGLLLLTMGALAELVDPAWVVAAAGAAALVAVAPLVALAPAAGVEPGR